MNETIWIASAIDALVVMSDNPCDLRVIVNVREDPLSDYHVLLHLTALFCS